MDQGASHARVSPSPSTLICSSSANNPTWESRYEELLQWRAERGDTCVPKAEGALGRWVARQRELKRTGKLDSSREEGLNLIGFVWNTVTAMWEERFHRLSEWKEIHGHCAVPIAQGELGTWVSKQRQLRKRGKLSREKINALNTLSFIWSTADADWEDKFKRLCEWTRRRGHASVPFNEGELGWWVNTQRQCKRKGKLSRLRESRLHSVGFVWNPSTSRTRASNNETTKTSTEASLFATSSDSLRGELNTATDHNPGHEMHVFDAEPAAMILDTISKQTIVEEGLSPACAFSEHFQNHTTSSLEPLTTNSFPFLAQNSLSSSFFPSPLLSSDQTFLVTPNTPHDLNDGSHISSLESTEQSYVDLLDPLFRSQNDQFFDQFNGELLTCHEEI